MNDMEDVVSSPLNTDNHFTSSTDNLVIDLDEADVMNLAVAPQYRRNRVATSLVDALVAALRSRNVTSLTLEVRASNEPAKALYGMLDFVQVGRRPNYYRNPKEDALILRKEWSL